MARVTKLDATQLRAGLALNMARQRHEAAAAALGMAEAELAEQMRVELGLGVEWKLSDWLIGFEETIDGSDHV